MARSVTKYWMVHGLDRGAPTKQHPTKESAEKEASRLAVLNPGSIYVVLKSTKSAFRADPPKVVMVDVGSGRSLSIAGRSNIDEHPF